MKFKTYSTMLRESSTSCALFKGGIACKLKSRSKCF